MHDSEQYLFEALNAGASGYVLKTAADRRRTDGPPSRDILAKLGMRDRVELTRYAVRRGLIDP